MVKGRPSSMLQLFKDVVISGKGLHTTRRTGAEPSWSFTRQSGLAFKNTGDGSRRGRRFYEAYNSDLRAGYPDLLL